MNDIKTLFHAVEKAIKERKSEELQDIRDRKKPMPPPQPAVIDGRPTYSTGDLMRLMGVTRITIYNWMKNGWIEGFKLDGDWRFTQDQVDAICKRKGRPCGKKA